MRSFGAHPGQRSLGASGGAVELAATRVDSSVRAVPPRHDCRTAKREEHERTERDGRQRC